MQRAGNRLAIHFQFADVGEKVYWPIIKDDRVCVEGLFKSTCFECFLGYEDEYLEWNVSPSGDWCGYAFQSYRKERSVKKNYFEPDGFEINKVENIINVKAFFDLEKIFSTLGWPEDGIFFGSLTAVIRSKTSEELTYWALKHVADKPDFHQKASFVQNLSND